MKTDVLVLLTKAAMRWKSNLGGSVIGVVEAAVKAIVDDFDLLTLRRLAGATKDSAQYEVYDLWPGTAAELGLPIMKSRLRKVTSWRLVAWCVS